MVNTNQKRMSTETLVLGAILTALVVVLQLLGSFIKLGPFSISLVLVPIIIGAATCGWKISGWLGFVFGMVVLFTDAGAFLAVSIPGTIITVLVKGVACGIAAGLVYHLVARFNKYVAVVGAAIICPMVNTGIFLLGCLVFFFETISEWGLGNGYENVFQYMIIGFVGLNFLVELASNIILSPVIVRLLNIRKKN